MEDLDVSQPYASALVNGKKKIGKKMAEKLNKFYGLDPLLLLMGDVSNDTKDVSDNTMPIESDKDKLILKLEEQVADLKEDKTRLIKELDEYKAKVAGLELELNQTKRRGTA